MSAPETALAPAGAEAALTPLGIERALKLVEEAKELPELRDIRDQAQLLSGLARSRDASREVQNGAAEVALRATRKMGAILDAQAKAGERATAKANLRRGAPTTPEESSGEPAPPPLRPPKLEDLGIDKNLARRAQLLAKVPEKTLETYVRAQKENPAGEITLAGALKVAKNPHAASHVNDGDPEKNVRFTHPELAAELHRRFHFSVDAFGQKGAPITDLIVESGGHFYTRQDDGFDQDYTDERFVFSNAEWDVLPEAVYLAHRQVEAGCPGWLHMVPTTQIGRRYWMDYIEAYRPDRGGSGVRVEATAPETGGRWNYGKPWDPKCEDPENKGVGMPTCLAIWQGERRRSQEVDPDGNLVFPPLVDCTCGHQHSEGQPCPVCPECKAGNDGSEPAPAPAKAEPEDVVTYEWCQGSTRQPVHAFAFESPETLSRCGEVRRGAMQMTNIRGAPPNVCPECRAGVDADVAERSAIDGLTLRRKKAPPAAAAPKPKHEPSDITAARFLGEATDLGFRAATPRPTLVTASCSLKGCGGVQFRFQVVNGELPRARLKQLREHLQEHRRQEKRPKKDTAKSKRKGKR